MEQWWQWQGGLPRLREGFAVIGVGRFGSAVVINDSASGVESGKELTTVRESAFVDAFQQCQIGNFEPLVVRASGSFQRVVALTQPGSVSVPHALRNRNKSGKTRSIGSSHPHGVRADARHLVVAVLIVVEVVARLSQMAAGAVAA